MNLKTARVQALQAFAAKDYDGAIRACNQGLYQAPDSAELHGMIAHAHMRMGTCMEALRSFETALQSTPQDTKLRCMYAAALDWCGDQVSAILEYRRILAQDPTRIAARYNLATLLVGVGDVAGAINEYQELIRQEPECVQAHNNLGVLLSAIGDPDGAIASFERSRRACPGDVASAVNLAREWATKGELRRAEEALSEALDLAPEFGEALALAGWIQLQQGRFQESEASYRMALAKGFDTPETLQGHQKALQSLSV